MLACNYTSVHVSVKHFEEVLSSGDVRKIYIIVDEARTERWGDDLRAEVMKAKESLEEAQDLLDWVADNDGLLTTSEEEEFLRLVESVTDSYDRTKAAYELDFEEDRPEEPDEPFDGDDDGESWKRQWLNEGRSR
jgi:hypothetical protein